MTINLLEIKYNNTKIVKFIFNEVKKNNDLIWDGQWFLFQLKKICQLIKVNDCNKYKYSNNIIEYLFKIKKIKKIKNNILSKDHHLFTIDLSSIDEKIVKKYGFIQTNILPKISLNLYGDITNYHHNNIYFTNKPTPISNQNVEKIIKKNQKLDCKKLKKKASNPTCHNVDYCIWDNGKCREKKKNEKKEDDPCKKLQKKANSAKNTIACNDNDDCVWDGGKCIQKKKSKLIKIKIKSNKLKSTKKINKKCKKNCKELNKKCNKLTGRCNKVDKKKEKKSKKDIKTEKILKLKDDIVFKSSPRSKWPFFLLSNFYGGSEFTFMSQRTTNPNLKELYLKLRDLNMNYKSFKNYRIQLQPSSRNKYEKPDYKDPYYYNKEGNVFIATGLIAKLISGSYKMKKRLKIVNKIAVGFGLEGNIKQEDFIDGTLKDKKKWMMNALELKFKNSFYKEILLKTNNNIIYENKSSRDKNSIWAGKTGLLGKLLLKVRKNLKQNGGNSPDWYRNLLKFI